MFILLIQESEQATIEPMLAISIDGSSLMYAMTPSDAWGTVMAWSSLSERREIRAVASAFDHVDAEISTHRQLDAYAKIWSHMSSVGLEITREAAVTCDGCGIEVDPMEDSCMCGPHGEL